MTTFLPILARELRVRSRGASMYWTRSAIAAVGILACLPSLAGGAVGTPATLGRQVFNGVLAVGFGLACAACLLTADAISAERRQKTLGLLFLTRVKTVDVLLGKLGSIGVPSLCALVAFLPVLMVPILAGGVTVAEACRKGAALFATLLLSLAAGLYGSAAEQRRARALWRSGIAVALLVLIPWVWYCASGNSIARLAGSLSPLVLLLSAGDASYPASPATYWISLVVVQIIAALLLVWAGIRLRHAVRESGGLLAERPVAQVAESKRTLGLYRWQPAKEDANPVEWVVYRQKGISAGLWLTALLAMVCSRWLLFAAVVGGAGVPALWLAWPPGLLGAFIGGSVIAFAASRFFARVRNSGELELLTTTPLGATTVVSDQWSVLKRIYVWPVLLTQLATLIPLLGGTGALRASVISGVPTLGLLSASLSLTNTFFGVAALCWLGLWFGLKARNQTTAILWSVGLAQAVPFLAELLVPIFLAALADLFPASHRALWPFFRFMPEPIVLLFYLWVIWLARRRLRMDLPGTEPFSLDLRMLGSNALHRAQAFVHTARHWTPQ